MERVYQIRGKTSNANSAEIYIYGDIGEDYFEETVAAKTFIRELNALRADEITVRINSYGGSVIDGIAIHNALKRHPATVNVVIDGIAASIASLIAMAGDTISMAENGLMMIHAPWGIAIGDSTDMRESADILDAHARAMAESYATATGKLHEEFMAMMTDGKEHWFTAKEAAEFGLIHEVTDSLPMAALAFKEFDLTRYARFQKIAASAVKPKEKEKMTVSAKKEPEVKKVDEKEIARQVLARDAERRKEIRAKFNSLAGKIPGDFTELMDECLDDHNCTALMAGERILAKLAEGVEPVAGKVSIVTDEADVKREAAVNSILARAGIHGYPHERGNPYTGATLLDISKDCLARGGKSYAGLDKQSIVGNAFTQSTSDFPVILEEAMHKALQASYRTAELSWRRFCAVGSVSDFRDHNRYRLGSLGNLDRVNENGEFENKPIPDGERSTVSVHTRGNIINLTRQAIINDDLGAFIGLATMQGRAAARTVEQLVYDLLAENGGLGPVMPDNLTLFHANHSNISTASGLSVEGLEQDRVLMGSQLDISGNEYLDLRPSILLISLALGGTARVLNNAEYDADASISHTPNKVRGLFNDIVDTPRLIGTRRYVFANPADAPVIEVSFLDGVQEPFMEQETGFTVDGTRWKVRLDVGAHAIDYRGAVTNAGTV